MHNKISITLFILLLLQLQTQAQSFTATTPFPVVGIEDKITVTFTYLGNDLTTFDKPGFDGFNIVSGPLQSSSQNMKMVNGKMVTSYSTAIEYILTAADTGTLTVTPATAKTKDGRTFHTEALRIKVVSGSNADIGNYRQMNDPFDLMQDLMETSGLFMVSTGPVYLYAPVADRQYPSKLMKAVKAELLRVTTPQEVGIYMWDSLPRLYLNVKDTDNVRQVLSRYYSTRTDGIYTIDIDTKTAFGFGQYTELQSAAMYYKAFEDMKREASTVPREVFITWTFTGTGKVSDFTRKIKAAGYTVEKRDKKAYENPMGDATLKILTISKTIAFNAYELNAMRDELLSISATTGAAFSMLQVKK